AVLGVQLVVTLLTATLMHRLAPHCSFARWLLCNGSCFDSPPLWLPPPRWANGYSEEKPLSVPRDAPFQLETCPLTAVDALGNRERPALALGGGLPLAKLAIRMGLAFVGSMLGAFLTFPGLRLAQTHLDALTMSEDRPMLQFLLQMSFLSPLIILGLWTKPIARDFLHQAPAGEMTFSLCESGGVGREGSWGPLCVPQPLSLREEPWVLGEDPGAGAASQPPHSPPHRLSGSALDSLSPWVPGAFCGYSWGLGPVPMLSPPPSSAHDRLVGPEEDEAQQTAARIAGALGSLLTPLFLRGVLTFLIWWTAACQLLSSLFGLYFHRYLAGS
uniref:Transmembrane protein 161A n=1 Tax=Panthera tigris altaica TaxID=74533 RepID=A0A8C9JUS8_PANTA